MVSDRFAKLWVAWDERLAQGEEVATFLARAKDEDLIELLAGESVRNRKYERDIIATEILNRLHHRHRDFPVSAEAVSRSAQASKSAAEAGQAAIHSAEALLKAAGQQELGTSVSASAYKSLDATEEALTAAQHHAAEILVSLSLSRLGDAQADHEPADALEMDDSEGMAASSARASRAGRHLTDDLENRMSKFGKGAEGRAAAKAGVAMSKAADATSRAAREHGQSQRAGADAEEPGFEDDA